MKRLITILGAGLLAAGIALPALAADMGYPPPPPPAEPIPQLNWSGFYLGLNAGYGWGTSDWTSSVTAGSTSPGGGLFGGTIGFNGQSGAFVFGVEGDAAGSWVRDSNSTGTGICAAAGCSIQTSWFGTARGRLGYSFGRALLYVTAGGAFGDVQMSTGGLTATVDRAGWTVGGGIEYAILGPWSAKLEYLYADLGSATCGAATCGVDTSVSFKENIVRVGVNYRFW